MSTPGSVTPISGSTSPIPLVAATAAGVTNSNGYRSRETGVIEKLLVSYGFIKCADREGRLFFHYSQFHGEAHTLHINDEIEFEVSMDTRTGKPVAVQVVKLQKGTVAFEVLSEDRILGEVTNPAPPLSLIPGQNLIKLGSLSYERMGEFFFLHYSASDLTNPDLALLPGDKVSFNIATEKRTGVMRARKITLVERAPPKRFNGIVTAMKESFGFIERSDIVKEIFFHYSEVLANVPDLHVGDHVEFSVQERNNKDVATEIRLLPLGTVQLEEISSELFVGTIDKPLPAKAPNKVMSEKLHSFINNTVIQKDLFGFGEKDRAANCLHTLCKGDKVSFLTITDKRNGQQRAAGVTLLLDKTIAASKEKREQGIVAAVKEGFGFIKCVERDSRLFFHCCEMLDPTHHVRMSDEVQFTVLLDPVAEKQRMHATRIRVLPKGTVIFHIISDQSFTGIVEALPGASPNTAPKRYNSLNVTFGVQADPSADTVARIPFASKDFKDWMEALSLKVGDTVEFKICEVKRTAAKSAVDIKLLTRHSDYDIETSCGEQCYGWISTLKDTFGFIESLNHGSEIFFHYSEMQAPVDKYKAGCPVTYALISSAGPLVSGEEKACALQVEVITDEEMPTSDVVSSKVLKPLKSVNPSQTSYQGLIEYKETNEADETTIKTISYSPLSLSDRRDFIQVGDKVTFQVSTDINSNCQRAANVNVNRETVKATVDSIKGEFGFINYEVKGGDTTGGSGKLFFHMSEVRDATQQITAGSTVEFSVIYNQRSGKFSASKVRLAEAQPKQQRPERLRLRSTCETTGPTVSVLRQPRGPTENTTGFAVVRHTEADDSQETENA
uniref:Cold shock domain-containing protein E1 n=1 Tax=Ciona intestinalis TaxID=7719 RepID=F6YAH3_CIOIN